MVKIFLNLQSEKLQITDLIMTRMRDFFDKTRTSRGRKLRTLFYIGIAKKLVIAAGLAVYGCLNADAQIIFEVEDPELADVKVYYTSNPFEADLFVKTSSDPHMAKADENRGIWYFTMNPEEADVKLFFTDYGSQADFKVYFTPSVRQAGWKKPSKRRLLYTDKGNGKDNKGANKEK